MIAKTAMKRPLDHIFRRNLESLMYARDISQAELARRIGVTPARINHLLSGHSGAAKLSTIEQIANALEIDPLELLTDRSGK